MTIYERVELYKSLYHGSTAPTIVSKIIADGFYTLIGLEALEAIRRLNTELSDYYQVSIPVITVWVRDDNYVQATGEIYLTEPDLEGFLHQFRHHLQNIERRYERRGLTAEGADPKYWRVPYEECIYRMPGEDDAKAWARFVIEVAPGKKAKDGFTVFGEDAEGTPMEDVENIETKFHIIKGDGFSDFYDTESIVIK